MTSSLSAIQLPPNRTRMRRRNGSAYNSLLGSGSGTRNRPIAPGESGPCCQDNPIVSLLVYRNPPGAQVIELIEPSLRAEFQLSRAQLTCRNSAIERSGSKAFCPRQIFRGER